jgi:MFS family permease
MPEAPARLWNRDFSAYWLGLAATALGDAGVYVALPFLVLASGGEAQTLAAVLVLGTAPRFLGPVIGSLADRVPLRIPVAVAAVLRTALFAGLGFVALSAGLPLWLIFVAAPVNGLLTLFVFSAGNVALPRLVPRDDLARANSLVQGVTMGLPLVGLGAAGAAVATVGPELVICIAAPLFLLMGGAALRIRFPDVDPTTRDTPWLVDMRRGAAFVLGRGPLAFLLVSSFALNASLNALNVVVPILMERNGRGAAGYGLFESLISAGILVGIFLVSLIGSRVRARVQIGIAQLLFAIGFSIMALGGLTATFGGGIVLGLGLGIGEVAILTLVQLAVPDGMRGKVLGVAFTANAAGLTFGAWAAGAALGTVEPTGIFAAAAVLGGAICTAWILFQVRDPRSLDRLVEAAAPASGD